MLAFLASMFLLAPVGVIIETELGAIEVEVDVERAPVTARNFLRYVVVRKIQMSPREEQRLTPPIRIHSITRRRQ